MVGSTPSRDWAAFKNSGGSTMSKLVVEAGDATFKNEVLDSKLPTLVDFWAPWCGPCRHLAPIIEELATEFDGRLKVVKVNTDDSQEVATRHNIRSIPTVALFKDGHVVETIVGALPKRHFVEMLQKHL
jgi:thioredoxin 1